MFTNSDFKMAFGLSITGSIAATTLILVNKSSLLVCWNETFIIGENSTKCWFPVNTSDKFTAFTTNLEGLTTKVNQYFPVQW